MTLDQGLSFGIVLATMVLFVWGRFRYDLVAALALLATVLTGLVPAKEAFRGFADDIVIIVASALVVSAAIGKSGAVQTLVRGLGPLLATQRAQVIVLVTAVTALSSFVKNIGALAMLIPVAFQVARRSGTSPSSLLMPMAFGSLLGGIVTLVGTSPNILVSRVREDLVGEPFGMFDFTPVGLGIALAGVAFLAVGYRLLPQNRKGAASIEAAFNLESYVIEARVPEGSTLVGTTVGELEAMAEAVEVTSLVRHRHRRYTPRADWRLADNDILILKGEPDDLHGLVETAKLETSEPRKSRERDAVTAADDMAVVEAVVTADSPLVGWSAAEMRLFQRFQVTLLAVSRSGERLTERLRSMKIRAGDVIVLRGDAATLPEVLGELSCLPLAERGIPIGRPRRRYLPLAILAVSMTLVGFGFLPVTIAFFGAALLLLLLGSLTLKEAYESIEWPILVLLGALIPVSDTLRTTGATDLIAGGLSAVAGSLPATAAVALIMVAAMAVTPFLNNAATVLVMGPIAAGFATKLGYRPDPFLMAVAIGAACDFLTPIGHQCNTLVLGPGGYRFGDYWRLGLPLSVIVIVVGVPLIALVWPISG